MNPRRDDYSFKTCYCYEVQALLTKPDRIPMKDRLTTLVRFIYENFAPLVIFYGVNHFFGLKPAIVVSTLFSFFEIAFMLYRRIPIAGLFKFSATITLIFGLIDLYADHSFLFKYEACVSNVFTGLFFGYSLIGEKSLIQEFYEKRPDSIAVPPELASYFRLLTLVWVIYFFLKAVAYFVVALNYSIEMGLVIRTILGSGSLYLMLFISIFGSKRIFLFLKKIGFFLKTESVSQVALKHLSISNHQINF